MIKFLLKNWSKTNKKFIKKIEIKKINIYDEIKITIKINEKNTSNTSIFYDFIKISIII